MVVGTEPRTLVLRRVWLSSCGCPPDHGTAFGLGFRGDLDNSLTQSVCSCYVLFPKILEIELDGHFCRY